MPLCCQFTEVPCCSPQGQPCTADMRMIWGSSAGVCVSLITMTHAPPAGLSDADYVLDIPFTSLQPSPLVTLLQPHTLTWSAKHPHLSQLQIRPQDTSPAPTAVPCATSEPATPKPPTKGSKPWASKLSKRPRTSTGPGSAVECSTPGTALSAEVRTSSGPATGPPAEALPCSFQFGAVVHLQLLMLCQGMCMSFESSRMMLHFYRYDMRRVRPTFAPLQTRNCCCLGV